ncbi:endonuclease IV [Paenibacillus beijingensis]|uniref:Endonuclease IV n=2 Tax=Paenibacillus beijingensis TaxID=1126833 RepID=A0A0D5NRS7_9BACL|nr:deoxyribonuclease IV [Paenibacillus beijingensis]AJY77991.1 endonuclease IV [Paenibacillus beijingensis]
MRYGSHLSIRKGYAAAVKEAQRLGAGSFQYFPKNPRSLAPKTFDRTDAGRCASLSRSLRIVSVAHSPYPCNLASEDDGVRKRTVLSLLNDLDIAEACGSVGVVVHFGIYKGPDILQGYRNIIAALDEITSNWNGSAKLLIENQAGDHANMGTTFEELAQVRNLSRNPERIGFCLDSCHLFASGVWKGDPDAKWAETAEKLGVLREIAAVHFNDSLFPSGSKRDRHAQIGSGLIGEAGLRWLLTLPALREAPFVLETAPDGDGTHKAQLKTMQEWGNRA